MYIGRSAGREAAVRRGAEPGPLEGSRAVWDEEYSSSIQQACMQSQVLSGLTDAHRIRRPREGYKGEEIIRE